MCWPIKHSTEWSSLIPIGTGRYRPVNTHCNTYQVLLSTLLSYIKTKWHQVNKENKWIVLSSDHERSTIQLCQKAMMHHVQSVSAGLLHCSIGTACKLDGTNIEHSAVWMTQNHLPYKAITLHPENISNFNSLHIPANRDNSALVENHGVYFKRPMVVFCMR